MAFTIPQTQRNPKLEWGRLVYGNHMRDIAQLQQDLEELDEKCKFLTGEAVHHQTQLTSDMDSSRYVCPVILLFFLFWLRIIRKKMDIFQASWFFKIYKHC